MDLIEATESDVKTASDITRDAGYSLLIKKKEADLNGIQEVEEKLANRLNGRIIGHQFESQTDTLVLLVLNVLNQEKAKEVEQYLRSNSNLINRKYRIEVGEIAKDTTKGTNKPSRSE